MRDGAHRDEVHARRGDPGKPLERHVPARLEEHAPGRPLHRAGEGRVVFCYFDNDEKGYAAQDALRLQEMISKS